MKFKKLESGRSMVEMLGVLAIIGVLSVGGISGYTISMRKYRANQIVDLASKLALVNYSLCMKEIIDGTRSITYGCGNMISLEDAGIGQTPAGVLRMFPYTYEVDPERISTIPLAVHFDDPKLCQAVSAVAGATCTSSGTYQVLIPFKID